MANAARPHLLGPWRRRCQWATTLLLLGVPFVRLGEYGLLRIDLERVSIEAFGRLFRIEELYLFLLFGLTLLLLFLLGTLVLGRVWCGWGCPQTTLSDLAEGVARRLGLQLDQQKMRGPVEGIAIPAGQRHRLDFAVVSPRPRTGKPLPVLFVLNDSRGKVLAQARATLTAPKEMPHER